MLAPARIARSEPPAASRRIAGVRLRRLTRRMGFAFAVAVIVSPAILVENAIARSPAGACRWWVC